MPTMGESFRKPTHPTKDEAYEQLMQSHQFDYDINLISPTKKIFLPAPYKCNYDGKWICKGRCGFENNVADEECWDYIWKTSSDPSKPPYKIHACRKKRPDIITKWLQAGGGEEYHKLYWGEAFKALYPPPEFDGNMLLWKCNECKLVQAFGMPKKVKDLNCETKGCGGLPKGQKIRIAINEKLKEKMKEIKG